MLCPCVVRVALTCLACLSLSCTPPEPIGFDLDEDGLPPPKGDFCADYPGGTLSGDDLLEVVNKDEGNQLSRAWAPTDLIAIPNQRMMPGRKGQLRKGAALALAELMEAAESEEGLRLVARSAYRSYATQCFTFASKVERHGLEHAKQFSAEPGRSQHQLGTTVDLTSADLGFAISQSMGESAEGLWLAENADRFGFVLPYSEGDEHLTGYAYEPWHFRYIGREAAREFVASGLVLDLYLSSCQGDLGEDLCPREEMPATFVNEGFIGGACQSDADCVGLGSQALCLAEGDGYPGGQCSLPCSRTCPDRDGNNSTTVCLASEAGNLCHSRCDFERFAEAGCREGYVCTDAQRPQGDSAQSCVPEAG